MRRLVLSMTLIAAVFSPPGPRPPAWRPPRLRTAKQAAGQLTPMERKVVAVIPVTVQPDATKWEPRLRSPGPRTPEQGAVGSSQRGSPTGFRSRG